MTDPALDARFDGATLPPELCWHSEPDHWSIDRATGVLRISPNPNTDFWQRTHYGFEADSGHFLHLRARGDFTLTTKVTSHPRHQYDQAGLMLRVSPACWLKTSVEFEPEGPNRLGAVVTNGQYSDWSTQPLATGIDTVWFRVQMTGADCLVMSSLDGVAWEQIRMAHLADCASASVVLCGLYACSPKAAGYQAEFHFLRFDPVDAQPTGAHPSFTRV